MLKYTGTLVTAILIAQLSFSQVQFEVARDEKTGFKTLKGILSRELLQKDTAFGWMHNDISWYKPNADCVANLTKVKDSIQLLVFIGTWCEDSHIVLPQLLKMLDQVKYDAKRITFVGVDRKKTTLGNLCEALNITKAPTIMVLKNGKEIGRVEEFGKYGLYDKELAEVLAKVN
jgi:thiol-disulfide isomerase/thioredoxin